MKLVKWIDDILISIQDKELKYLASGMAFNLILLVIPMFTSFTAFVGALSFTIKDNILLPKEIAKVLIGSSSPAPANWIVYLLAIILAIRSSFTIVIIANNIYKIEDKLSRKESYIRAVKLLLLFILMIFALTLLPIIGSYCLDLIFSRGVKASSASVVTFLFNVFSLPIIYIIITYIITLIYRVAPSIKLGFKEVIKGSLFSSLSMMIFTKIYSLYLAINEGVSTFYGSMSSVIATMIWAYIISYIFITGMKLNLINDK